MEAIRSIRHELPKTNTMNIHLSLVPYIRAAGELKTKPTQHSVQELRRIGITPHMLVCRTERELPKNLKDKLALACDIDRDAVIEAGDAQSIYQVPLQFIKEGILNPLSNHFNIKIKPNMEKWDTLVKNILVPQQEVTIAFVGKYLDLKESYKSLIESLIHSGAHLNTKVNIHWCDSERIEDVGAYDIIGNSDAILSCW